MRWVLIAILGALASVGCASPDRAPATRKLTERERDSLIAISPLPGATVVGRALATSDASAKRTDRQAETLREIGDSDSSGEETP